MLQAVQVHIRYVDIVGKHVLALGNERLFHIFNPLTQQDESDCGGNV